MIVSCLRFLTSVYHFMSRSYFETAENSNLEIYNDYMRSNLRKTRE